MSLVSIIVHNDDESLRKEIFERGFCITQLYSPQESDYKIGSIGREIANVRKTLFNTFCTEPDESYFSCYLTNMGSAHFKPVWECRADGCERVAQLLEIKKPIVNCEAPFYLVKNSMGYNKRHSDTQHEFKTSKYTHYCGLVMLSSNKDHIDVGGIRLISWKDKQARMLYVPQGGLLIYDPTKFYYQEVQPVVMTKSQTFNKGAKKRQVSKMFVSELIFVPFSVMDASCINSPYHTELTRYKSIRITTFAQRRSSQHLAFPLRKYPIFADMALRYQNTVLSANQNCTDKDILINQNRRTRLYWFDNKEHASILKFIRLV